MKALFIRHAKALDRSVWLSDDMQRPLSDKGVSNARTIFKAISKIYSAPDLVFTSEALRARETADIFMKYFSASSLKVSPLLNPGARIEDIKILLSHSICANFVVFIGHEPDFSDIISSLLGCQSLKINIKKNAITELDIEEDFSSTLKAFIPPKLFV